MSVLPSRKLIGNPWFLAEVMLGWPASDLRNYLYTGSLLNGAFRRLALCATELQEAIGLCHYRKTLQKPGGKIIVWRIDPTVDAMLCSIGSHLKLMRESVLGRTFFADALAYDAIIR